MLTTHPDPVLSADDSASLAVPLRDWVRDRAAYHRSAGTEAGDWMAQAIDRIADELPHDASTRSHRVHVTCYPADMSRMRP